MAQSRRVTYEQLEVLWEFLNSHRDIAMGYNKSAQAREMSRRLWAEVAQNLNCVVGGAVKDPKGWSAYWVDYKGKIKRKSAAIRLSQSRTGGGPNESIVMNDIEKKYLYILGEDYGIGLPGIQVNPLDTDSTHAPSTSQISQSILEMVPTEVAEEIFVSRLSPADFSQAPEMEIEQSQSTAMPPSIRPAPAVAEGNVSREGSRPRRQRRATPMSQQDARRGLVESSRSRVEALQNINQNLGSILNVLSQIAALMERRENRLMTTNPYSLVSNPD